MAVSTTSRSRISPGICAELKTSFAPGCAFITESCGFQATTALASGLPKAPTMSASEVFTVLTSVGFSPAFSSARASR